jgi:hypothetical protein
VDRYLPVNSNSYFIYDNWAHRDTDSTDILWVALAEKAYAQLAQEGWSRGAGAKNSYGSLGGGDCGLATAQITGLAYTWNAYSSATDLANAFNAGKLVTLATNASDSQVATNIVSNHCYALTKADAKADQFTLMNPWGLNGGYEANDPNFKPGTVTLTWAGLQGSFSGWAKAGSKPVASAFNQVIIAVFHGPELNGWLLTLHSSASSGVQAIPVEGSAENAGFRTVNLFQRKAAIEPSLEQVHQVSRFHEGGFDSLAEPIGPDQGSLDNDSLRG